jgi:hypothetical protein
MKTYIILASLLCALLAHAADKNAPASPTPPPEVEYMGMKLHPDWKAKRETKTLEMTRALAFFSLAALEGREEGKDIQPRKILWDLDWLMPVDDAEKKVPGLERAQMGAAAVITTPNFPQRSLFVRSYQGKFTDPHSGEPFKEVRLISDLKRQLVSVQLIYNHPPAGAVRWEEHEKQWWTPESWMLPQKDIAAKDIPALVGRTNTPGPTGRREPYYDYVTMKQNGSTRQQVWYGVYRYNPGSPGVTCIHTELVEGSWMVGKVNENIRWYLPAPLARKILEVAVATKAAAEPAR